MDRPFLAVPLLRTLDAGSLTTRCDVGGARALAFDAKGERLAASGLRDAKSNTSVPAGSCWTGQAGRKR